MPLRRIPASWWRSPTPRPALTRNQRLARVLIMISRSRDGRARCDHSSWEIQTLAERGFIVPYRWLGPSGQDNRSCARMTEAGWTALWTEDLGGEQPLPKSERREKRQRQV